MSKLHDAIRKWVFGGGDAELAKIRDMVKKTPKLLSEPDENGEPPLFLAICSMRAEPPKVLIELGADVNAKNGAGYSALMSAAASSPPEIAELMMKKGARLDPQENGTTVLHQAMMNSSHARALAELFLNHGVDLHARTSYEGWSAFDKAAYDNLVEAAEFLISKGAEVNHVDFRGFTALDIAAERKYDEMVALLTKHGGRRSGG